MTEYRCFKNILAFFLNAICLPMIISCTSGGGMVADLDLLRTNDPNAATVTVMRKSERIPAGSPLKVFIDTTLVGTLGSGDMVQFPVSAGEHFVETEFIMSTKMFRNPQNVIPFRADQGKTYFFYYSVYHKGANHKLDELTEAEGNELISSGDFMDISKHNE